MAKKAKKVSWRTLARRADKERSPRKATALRKQAWQLRRADRKKVSNRTIKSLARDTLKKANAEGALGAAAPQGISRVSVNRLAQQVTDTRGAPGRGEIVGGAYSQLADRLVKLSRKKGGTDTIQFELSALAASSKYEGCVETDKAATKRLIEVQQILADRVICGFIAEVEASTAQYHGLPPAMTFNVSSFLVVKIIDALNKAGYHGSGMNTVSQTAKLQDRGK